MISAGSLSGLFSPWTDSSVSEVHLSAQAEHQSPDASSSASASNVASISTHAFFGIEEEKEVAESPTNAIRTEQVAGNWSTFGENDCSGTPRLSITLREGITDIFGFGTVTVSACDDEPKYALIEGTILEDRIFLRITNEAADKLLYTFEGTLSDDDLVGNLTANDGRPTATIVLSRS